MDDYRGSFDPDADLSSFSRRFLARLGREYMLHGHVFDRVGLPQVMARYGTEEMNRVAIEEWMGASPVYTRRMRTALGFSGEDVGTVFKGLQLDVGAPHQYMDFRFRLDSPTYGEFWLDHCGALVDVEPMGPEMVFAMCHDIEDPTFDATAVATNARAQVRPLHRPPRDPADRHPHCHWRVSIDPSNDPVEEIERTGEVRSSRLARLELDSREAEQHGSSEGRDDYSVAFDPDFQLEDLSQRALVKVCKEFAIQVHLLVRSYLLSIAEHHGETAARECGEAQFVGSAWIMAERLSDFLGVRGEGIDTVLKVMQLHPALQPREYADLRFEKASDQRGVISLHPCDALDEGDGYSWFALLDEAVPPGLRAMAQAVDPTARLSPVTSAGPSRAWEISVGESSEPLREPADVALGRLSGSADWVFIEPREGRRTGD